MINHLDGGYLRQALEHDVRTGLTSEPKWLPPKWFYDEAGSELFSRITRLEEYYPTRRELAILRSHAGDIVRRSGSDTLIELGSGTSEKTALLLQKMRVYMPVDVDAVTLRASARRLSARFPHLAVRPVCADFERHLSLLPPGMVAFLGGTIGNLDPEAREMFLKELRSTRKPGDAFLLGADLVKDKGRLIRAYDDAQGVTAAFNRNVLHVINRELNADFVPDDFAHVARYDEENEWVEMRLRATRPVRVHIRDLDLTVYFVRGEEMRTEISAKFRRDGLAAELARAGFALERWYSDPDGDFALALSTAR
ncbi:L-histidine N(alpha)-methyltransferase [Microtetraspora fusca]|uniref:L-histidine N(Alpha)-methyltransferase n=1 Tax=Microtetraspora fusca TaxID=1997 RepID=A0ABW6VDC0_MICFU